MRVCEDPYHSKTSGSDMKERKQMKEIKLKTALHLNMCLERTRAILEKLRGAPGDSFSKEVL